MTTQKDFCVPSSIGEGIESVVVTEILVKEGDTVELDQEVIVVESTKASVVLPAPCKGKIISIPVHVGDEVAVHTLLYSYEPFEEAAEPPAISESAGIVGNLSHGAHDTSVSLGVVERRQTTSPAKKIKAPPAVRKRATELGINLADISGTGEDGAITPRDLEDHIAKNHESVGEKETTDGFVPVDRVRHAMAEHMTRAMIPTATVMDEVTVTSWYPKKKATLLAQVAYAMHVAALCSPNMNATFKNGMMRLNESVHIALAVQTSEGLVVPVLRDVDKAGYAHELQEALDTLADQARNGTLGLGDYVGATIALSNFGALGFGKHAVMMIPQGLTAIVGIGRVESIRMPSATGGATTEYILPLSITFDHRHVNGAEACTYGKAMKKYLTSPPTNIGLKQSAA